SSVPQWNRCMIMDQELDAGAFTLRAFVSGASGFSAMTQLQGNATVHERETPLTIIRMVSHCWALCESSSPYVAVGDYVVRDVLNPIVGVVLLFTCQLGSSLRVLNANQMVAKRRRCDQPAPIEQQR